MSETVELDRASDPKAVRGYALFDWGKSAFETSVTVAILPAWFAYLFLKANGLTTTIGSIEMTGDAVRVHPAAQANVALLGVESADELAKVMAASGLAQNLGALRALATVGIQAGHMKLHVRNMAVTAGAVGEEVDKVASILRERGGRITQASVIEALGEIRSE